METIDLKAYWDKVAQFSQYPEDKRADGYALGLLAEAGEVAGLFEGMLRGKYTEVTVKELLPGELGDVCFHLAGCLWEYDWKFDDEIVERYDVSGARIADPDDLIPYAVSIGVYAFDIAETTVFGSLSELPVAGMIINLARLATYADTALQAVLDANVRKLTERYGDPDAQP